MNAPLSHTSQFGLDEANRDISLVMVNSHQRSSGTRSSQFRIAVGTRTGSVSSIAQESSVSSLPSSRDNGFSPVF